MKFFDSFLIDGKWVSPLGRETRLLYNPANGEIYGKVAMATAADADAAIRSAHAAFIPFAATSKKDRLQLLKSVLNVYERRHGDFAAAITEEMGAPSRLSYEAQVTAGADHIRTVIDAFETFEIEQPHEANVILRREPIGVCVLITPWNWPLNQIAGKVAPALAAGCTMVLKPSELTPMSATIFAEVMVEAGVPAGVFNLVHGDGSVVGTALSSHPLVDMVSFTGSTAAGVKVAINAAPTVKRVTQELGGKSANILLRDADFDTVIEQSVHACMENSGQSCNAPTRIFVPEERHDEIAQKAAAVANALRVGNPLESDIDVGPLVSHAHYERVVNYIRIGQRESAVLAAGGPEPITHLTPGYFVRPTVFAHVTPGMTIARDEIFGPVLSILSYRDEDEAIALANDTPYGLAAYLCSQDETRALSIARRLRAGQVHLNMAIPGAGTPFGGYRQSGNGREGGIFGIEEFTEIKAIIRP